MNLWVGNLIDLWINHKSPINNLNPLQIKLNNAALFRGFKMRTSSRFREAATFLKKNAGIAYPIYIRRMRMSFDLDGSCEFRKDHFLIKVSRELNEDHSIDVVLHEVAHAMSWDKDDDVHGRNWGLAYSKIYRKFLDDFLNR